MNRYGIPRPEPTAQQLASAQELRRLFEAMRQVGFDEVQALTLVVAVFGVAAKNQQ